MEASQENRSSRNWQLVATVAVLAVVSLLLIFVGRNLLYPNPQCHHSSTFKGGLQFDSEVSTKRLTGPEKTLYQLGTTQQLCGSDIAEIETLLAQAHFKTATEHGAEFLFQLPRTPDGDRADVLLWLFVIVDYRCGHVVECGVYERPLF